MIIPNVDKAAGLDRCKKAFIKHLRRTGEPLQSPSCTVATFDAAHSELWEDLASLNFRAYIGGSPSTDASNDLILFIVAQCAAIQLEQYPTLT